MEQQEINQEFLTALAQKLNQMQPNNMPFMSGMQVNNNVMNISNIEIPIDYNGVQVKATFNLPEGSGIEQVFNLLNMLESSGIRLYRYGKSGNRGFQYGNNQNYWSNNRNRF